MQWMKLLFCFWFFLIQKSHQVTTDTLQETNSFGVPTLLLDYLQLTLSSKLLVDIFSPPTAQTLKGYLGWLPKKSNLTYTSCSGEDSVSGTICLRYGKNMKLVVMQDNTDHCSTESETCHIVPCHKIHWTAHIGGAMDCFLLGEDSWYGGGEILGQKWPLESESTWYPTVTGDPLHHASGNVVENLWISSSGFAIHVEHSTPLFVSFNESGSGKLCFTTSSKKHPYKNEITENHHLTYSICSAASVKEAFVFSLHRWIQKPYETPHEILFHYPMWSTWARYKKNIDENTVLQFAAEIVDSGLSASQIEIDDKWEDCYGNLQFDTLKFPSPETMTYKLKSLDLPVTLWVHLFCNKECEAYEFGKNHEYWVKDRKGKVSEVKWWNGIGAALDVTNKKAVKWFVERLEVLQTKYGIESFKFDAGELLWFNTFSFHNSEVNVQPNLYSQLYAEIAAQFGNRVEVRIGYNSQHLPVVIRMFDKYSTWDSTNGIKSLIPTALHLSLAGYYFILPDMIGGNNYISQNSSLPDRELYIRWLEVNVFLPFIQFSITPWDYDDGVLLIAKKMLSIREEYSNYILKIAQQATISGEPIIRPLWWIAPDDTEALTIDSEFLVGDGILVAPVLEKGARHRDIYLPDGRWADVQKGKVYTGSQWLYDYDAPLNFLPFFIGHS